MRENASVELKRYYILHLISMVYKMLAILAVIFAIVSAINDFQTFAAIPYEEKPQPAYLHLAAWLASDLIIGGIVALSFYVLARLIDVQLAMSGQLRQLVNHMKDLKATNQQILDELRKTSLPRRVVRQRDDKAGT